MNERPSWDMYFMKIAEDVSTRSTCIRRQVGAVILRTIFKVPSGERHELCRGLHAEQNAIIQAAYYGVSVKGSAIYVTHQPCSICTKMLINSGIDSFIYRFPYSDSLAESMIKEAGINCRILE